MITLRIHFGQYISRHSGLKRKKMKIKMEVSNARNENRDSVSWITVGMYGSQSNAMSLR